MKLYKTTFIDDAVEENRQSRASWDGTQADSAKTRKGLKATGMRDITTQETDVLTDKASLLRFLNQWCVVQ